MNSPFSLKDTLHNVKHYLPTQAPLKDFIHHNTLHAFQHLSFNEAIKEASEMLGYKTYLSLNNYRKKFKQSEIDEEILGKIIVEKKGKSSLNVWKEKLLFNAYDESINSRIGKFRERWKETSKINISKHTHPLLFRMVSSYIDQGISEWNFPKNQNGFFESIKELHQQSYVGIFKSKRVDELLQSTTCHLLELLSLVVGNQTLYEQYLFDQQFEHPGWSGMVAFLEDNPKSLLDERKISLEDFIRVELLLEIDYLDQRLEKEWQPLAQELSFIREIHFLENQSTNELFELYAIWQQAYEWTYYNRVLCGIQKGQNNISEKKQPSFQAVFCIDDRECSFRRYIENKDKNCLTYATAGFFNVEFYYQPEGGQFYTKCCPAPVTPKHLIKEFSNNNKRKKEAHFTKHAHGLFSGWIISQTLGIWSALKLFANVFKPSLTPATSFSFQHMSKHAQLTIESTGQNENNLQVGFTIEEMANRIEALLKSIGMVDNFASIIYFVGHGSSSVNNPYYAGYDCGACSGRPGSVNARVAAFMANHLEVRKVLRQREINIPENTQFVGALHDTCRDEIEFFDIDILSEINKKRHQEKHSFFIEALSENAKERARRFVVMDNKKPLQKIHQEVKLRSVSLFEPRPEYNHATNALCVVGRRELTQHLFLDRRAFMNSYDYNIDPEGKYLQTILNAVAPVCGGINLEYYFSRVDNQKLGAGSKLPHNVVGLIALNNGADGDLRPGLPQQMIEIHDPLRLMVVVEHYPEVVLSAIKANSSTYEWFKNEWIHLVVIHPQTKMFFRLCNSEFELYTPAETAINQTKNLTELFEQTSENINPLIVVEP